MGQKSDMKDLVLELASGMDFDTIDTIALLMLVLVAYSRRAALVHKAKITYRYLYTLDMRSLSGPLNCVTFIFWCQKKLTKI